MGLWYSSKLGLKVFTDARYSLGGIQNDGTHAWMQHGCMVLADYDEYYNLTDDENHVSAQNGGGGGGTAPGVLC